MPEEFNPAWEYWEPEPEIAEAMAAERVRGFDGLGLELEDGRSPYAPYRKGASNVGFRFDRGNPDAVLFDPEPAPFRIGPSRTKPTTRRVRCHRCGRGFDGDRHRYIFCRDCLPSRGRCPIPSTVCCECGDEFRPRERQYFRFCSPKCGGSYFRAKSAATGCPVCGGEVPPGTRGMPKVYCSRRCQHVMLQRRSRGGS